MSRGPRQRGRSEHRNLSISSHHMMIDSGYYRFVQPIQCFVYGNAHYPVPSRQPKALFKSFDPLYFSHRRFKHISQPIDGSSITMLPTFRGSANHTLKPEKRYLSDTVLLDLEYFALRRVPSVSSGGFAGKSDCQEGNFCRSFPPWT